jgi:tetratricopeptide (TPR) repeat protein
VEESEDLRRATALWRAAYRYQMERELDRAIEHYQRSVAVHPTAEAHTFLGWSLSFQGRLEEATAECRRAIEIDPDFGNPYNDIGVYLMQQGKLDEAWLGKAKQARRYEPRQFPFLNLGRVYLKQGRWWDALREFEGDVKAAPGDGLRYRNGRERGELVTPGEPVPVTLTLYPTSNLFMPGHRIRLDVSSSNFPRFDVNPNTGEAIGRERRRVVADNTVFHERGRDSRVVVPII